MGNIYQPTSLGITAPSGGFQTGGWYSGRQYWNGTLSEPNVIHPESNQQGAGAAVNPTVVAASASLQGKTPEQFNTYFAQESAKAANVAPAGNINPTGSPTGAPTTEGSGLGMQPQAGIDLPSLYTKLYENAGINTLQEDYSTKQKQFAEAKAKNNDNPFLSEASRVGRESKLQKSFDEQTANLLSDIAMKKADVEMQLNLATKQYDINTQAAKTALDQFNSLLSSGALNNASGQDIANLTRTTGLSSTMIQSAIKANKTKGASTSTYSDGSNDYFVTIDNEGNIINKQLVGPSKPSAQTNTAQKTDYVTWAKTDADAGKTLDDLMSYYQGYLDKQNIWDLYMARNYYKNTPEQIKAAKKQWGIT